MPVWGIIGSKLINETKRLPPNGFENRFLMKSKLKFYNDFPKQGIVFVDIIPLLQDKTVFAQLCAEFGKMISAPNLAAPEARGFLFAAPQLLAHPLVENLIPIRKSGKLPFAEGDLQEVAITKEYGADHLYYRLSDLAAGKADGNKIFVSIFDDVLATGGTAEGIARSLQGCSIVKDGVVCEVVVKEFLFLVELDELRGAERLATIAPVKSLIHL